jgi:hypothetical protein
MAEFKKASDTRNFKKRVMYTPEGRERRGGAGWTKKPVGSIDDGDK